MLQRLPEPNLIADKVLRDYIFSLIRVLRDNYQRPLTTTDVPEGSNLYFTNERAQDAVGGILLDTATIDLTYNDATPTISADLKDTTVVPGSYTNTNLTVDAQGRITAAASGTDQDYLSGVYYIAFGDTLTVPLYKQMITKENLFLSGTLVVNGQYFLEA